jgi:flagellar biosynthesis chaperone FliJ
VEDLQAVVREVAALREQVNVHAASVETLGRRLEAATQEMDDYARQLTNQTSVLSTYGQWIDAQAAQFTSLGENVATAAKQIKGLDQKVTVQETQIIAHDKQLAAQATQLSALGSRTTVATPRMAVSTPNPGPPALEALSAPVTRAPAAQQLNEASSTVPDGTSARPVISLPAGLGAAGLRGRAESQQGVPR